MKPARTRIAPSPTGYMHVGTLRTALFDYFLARQTQGQFILRLEDTDRKRLVDGAAEALIKTFNNLGIDYDEGPILVDGHIAGKGDFGPYIQSERLDIYKKFVQQLLDSGNAYHCFCSKERLDEMRTQQQAVKQTPKYDRKCLSLSEDEVQAKIKAGESYVIRMKIPEGETIVNDLIRGKVKFNNNEVDDQVIIKSDNFPTYHFAVVVDDYLMKITHVLRGEEWLSSTPKHIILQNMLGFNVPAYAHVPLLLNSDRTKLSKRQGDVAVEDYLKKGYLPKALINFISTLGFNPTSDREIYSIKELIELFDITKVKKGGAVMNIEKLDWMNNQYIKELSEDEMISVSRPFLSVDIDDETRRAIMVERDRINRLDELEEKIKPYFSNLNEDFEAEMLIWKKADKEDSRKNLINVLQLIMDLNDSDFESIEKIEGEIKNYIERDGLQNGNVLWPLRVALSRNRKSASPFELLWIFGRKKGSERIKKAISLLE